ncbi:hypothetical protein QBC40DRAFT_306385 [Triangularia verruculosa]|uniref:Uncharacterized protein n=1 Tax=Triangularia verruculosa TaxID=2587418 RepID=A0AAN7AVT9_9PEZI|nr:hypothetical protein QBC40DRAFT_306385 [Triangularia verruculosa]
MSSPPSESEDDIRQHVSSSKAQHGPTVMYATAPDTPGVPREDGPSIADLFREMQETNRLLKLMLAAQKLDAPASPDHQSSRETAPDSNPDLVKMKVRELVHGLAHQSFSPVDPSNIQRFVRVFIEERISHKPKEGSYKGEYGPGAYVPIFVCLRDNLSGPLSEIYWNWERPNKLDPVRRVFMDASQVSNVAKQWASSFDLDASTFSPSRETGWIIGKNPAQEGAIIGCPLFYHGPGPVQKLVTARSVFDREWKAIASAMAAPEELTSPGSLWHCTAPLLDSGSMALERVALITALVLNKPNTETDIAHRFLHEFAAGWKPLYLRGSRMNFTGWSGNSDTTYQHTIRCFSPANGSNKIDFGLRPHVKFIRQSGQFPSHRASSSSSFTERRMGILCHWDYSYPPHGFRIIALTDAMTMKQDGDINVSNDLFTDWDDRHFAVQGPNAGYHLLQSSIHRLLMFWETEWGHCLDALESNVNTSLRDILDDEASSRLMFDTSFERSRVYFKTLQMLRIFADAIRETGRDLQELDPEKLIQGNFRRAGYDVHYFMRQEPLEDKALWNNWKILLKSQQRAEEKLLRRITEKTEEITSLRDGLFNATSLREASRSTTMNRYVIVFTIMTVLYLPPSFTSALFGTPLFEAESQEETVERFKTSTIIVCVITYVLAISLIWLADKWDIAGVLFHDLRTLWRGTVSRFKRRSDGWSFKSQGSSSDALVEGKQGV